MDCHPEIRLQAVPRRLDGHGARIPEKPPVRARSGVIVKWRTHRLVIPVELAAVDVGSGFNVWFYRVRHTSTGGAEESTKRFKLTGQHRNDREEDFLHRLDGRPSFARRLVVIRVVARCVEDRNTDLAVGVN